jgi:alpha-beta hydrolase superfamily lysophospholipase
VFVSRALFAGLVLATAAVSGSGRAAQPDRVTSSEWPNGPPVEAETVDVPRDLPAFVVRGRGGECPRMIFLSGMCSHALGYIQAFEHTAHDHGGVMAVQGDIDCGGGSFRKYTPDPDRADARVREARAAACNGEAGENEELTLIGYSQGAYLAERMAERFPNRYTRLVLIGAPTTPSPARLRRSRGAVMISGELDATYRMKEGATLLRAAGIPATYMEMPGARHGQLLEGEDLIRRALEWLDTNARPLP